MNPIIPNESATKINTEPKDAESILEEKPRVSMPEVNSSLLGRSLKIETSSPACQYSPKIYSIFRYGMLKHATIKMLLIIINALAGN